MVGIIYLATNQVNGKVYVGQTIKTLTWRKGKHYNRLSDDDNAHFHNALRKYKRTDWTWEILEEVISDTKKEAKEILTKYEKYYIKVLDSKNRLIGYNGTVGGDGVVDPSEDVRYSMGKSWRGKRLPNDMKKLMSESHKGKPCPESAKIKIGNALRGKSNWWKDRPKSIEQKEKMRQSALKRYTTVKEII
jgi:group I intron endonuclease